MRRLHNTDFWAALADSHAVLFGGFFGVVFRCLHFKSCVEKDVIHRREVERLPSSLDEVDEYIGIRAAGVRADRFWVFFEPPSDDKEINQESSQRDGSGRSHADHQR